MVKATIARRAREDDVEAICAFGAAVTDFEVNEVIKFYEKSEIIEWIKKPDDNIVLVAERQGKILGFLFCKIMSHHWGLLDNFFVDKRARGARIAKYLFEALIEILTIQGLNYLSILIRSDKEHELVPLCEKVGFRKQQSYVWLDMEI